MNQKEREALKLKIKERYTIDRVTDLTVEIVQYFIDYPRSTNGNCVRSLEDTGFTPNAIYRAIKKLRLMNILNSENTVDLRAPKTKDAKVFPLPNIIKDGELPPREYKYVHICAYLSGLKVNEQVKDTGMTREQYLEKLQSKLIKSDELIEQMHNLQNLLAVCSILAGNLESWINMRGTIYTGDIK